MKSAFLRLNVNDMIRTAIVVSLAALFSALLQFFQAGTLPDLAALQSILITSGGAGMAYLTKNLLTNSQDRILTPEKK
jgi:hypothetical protein